MFEARPGSRRGGELEVLTTLVDAYEEFRFAVPAPDPIEAIKYFLESRGLIHKNPETYI